MSTRKIENENVHIEVEKDQYATEDISENYRLFLNSRKSEIRYVEIPTIQRLLNGSLKGQRVIDLACGHGNSTRILADLDPDELIGVDLSPEQVKMAQQLSSKDPKYAKIQYLVRDCSKPLELGLFDLVFSKHLLNYAHDKDILNGMITSMFNATKPGHTCAGMLFSPLFEEKDFHRMNKYGLDIHKPNQLEVFIKMYDGDIKTGKHLMNLRIFVWPLNVYEQAFIDAGFKDLQWVNNYLEEDPDGTNKHLFHKDYVDAGPSILFKAKRPDI